MKMKKIVAFLCCLVIGSLGLVLTGCGGDGGKYADSPYLGTWKATTANYAGIEMNVADILGGDFTMTLEASGECTIDIAGDEESGDWEPSDKGMKIVDSEESMEFTAEDAEHLVLDYQGMTLTLEKQ